MQQSNDVPEREILKLTYILKMLTNKDVFDICGQQQMDTETNTFLK